MRRGGAGSSMTTEVRVDLNVPYAEKDRAKELGARWDVASRTWFAPPGADLRPLRRWLPRGTIDEGIPDAERREDSGSGVGLASYLADIRRVVLRNGPGPAWIRAELDRVTHRENLFLELVERNDRGDVVAKARGFAWREDAAAIARKFAEGTGGPLRPGIKVLLHARVDFHAEFGLSLVVDDVDPAFTLGDLAAKLRLIRCELSRERLIELNRSLPPPPEFVRVAVISPVTSAGLEDFRREADRLEGAGLCRFRYVAAAFQGPDAPSSLQAAVQVVASEHSAAPFDALVIIRGGGSATDLAWLNDLELARDVCRAPLPVLTGIGHKRDSTILDEVAHAAFDTPSKVALHIASVIADNARGALADLDRIRAGLRRALGVRGQAVDTTFDRVRHDTRRVVARAHEEAGQAISAARIGAVGLANAADQSLWHDYERVGTEGRARLREWQAMAARHQAALSHRAQLFLQSSASEVERMNREVIDRANARLVGVESGLGALRDRAALGASRRIALGDAGASALFRASLDATYAVLRMARTALESYARQVVGLGPGATLQRGFAVVRDPGGRPVTSREAARAAKSLSLEFRDGTLDVDVREERGGEADGGVRRHAQPGDTELQ